MQRVINKKNIYRMIIYFMGIVLVCTGIVLCVKCELGISPISSIPYVLGFMTPFSFGTLTMCFHLVNSFFQYVVEKKTVNIKVFLQVPVAILFGVIIDFIKSIMNFQAENLVFRIGLMILSVLFTALGMHLMLSMKLVQNPPDGTVRLIGEKLGKETGTIKIIYDVSMTVISILLSIVVLHKVVGFGVATIVSAIFVGKTLNLIKKFIRLDTWD